MGKTQKQIATRLNKYIKGTVDSPYRVNRPTQYDRRFGTMEVGALDVDKSFHSQCFDLANDYYIWLTGNPNARLLGEGAKDIPYVNTFPEGWKIIKNERDTIAKQGWIVIFAGGQYSTYGHVGIVYETGDLNSFIIVESNWNGWANKKPQTRRDYYQNITHFIIPPVAKEVNKITTAKTTAPKQKKPVSITQQLVSTVSSTVRYTDEIKNYNMAKRGKNPAGIVIHNDAGGFTATQYRNQLLNAGQQRLENGIAHSYISEEAIWEAIPENKIAWHTA